MLGEMNVPLLQCLNHSLLKGCSRLVQSGEEDQLLKEDIAPSWTGSAVFFMDHTDRQIKLRRGGGERERERERERIENRDRLREKERERE